MNRQTVIVIITPTLQTINQILSAGGFDAKYKAKDYNSNLNEVAKFLKLIAYPNVEIDIDGSNWINIHDPEKINAFGLKGELIYTQNLNFLYKMGLKDFIQKMYAESKISLSR